MGEVVPARTSRTLHPLSPPSVLYPVLKCPSASIVVTSTRVHAHAFSSFQEPLNGIVISSNESDAIMFLFAQTLDNLADSGSCRQYVVVIELHISTVDILHN